MSEELVVDLLATNAFINVLLYGLELVLLYMYFRKDRELKIPKCNKIIFAINISSDSVCTIAVCIAMYLYMMAKRGDITVLPKERWPEIVILVTTATSIYTMQLASVQRHWSMSKTLEVQQQTPSFVTRRCTNILVTTGVASSISVSLAGLIYSLIELGSNKRPSGLFILWLAGMTVAYVILIPGLVWRLYKITILANQHQRICYQLFKTAIGADIPPGVLTTVILILSATTKSSVAMAFIFILGRVGTCTALLALILCETEKEQTEDQASNTISSILGITGPTVEGDSLDIELGSLSEGSFSHASFLSELEIDRRVEEDAARRLAAES